MVHHDRLTVLSMLIVVNQLVGMVCQFNQGTDPRFPLLYFSVDSAVLAVVAAVLTLKGCDSVWSRRLRLAAAVGVLMSAVVFAAVIAPATPTGTWFQPHDDIPVRTATLLIHGVAPVLVTVDYLLRPTPLPPRASTLWAYAWPLAYLAGLGALAGVLGPEVVPYLFMRPSLTGWPTVLAAFVALFVLVGVLGWVLGVLGRRSAIDVARGEST